MSLRQLRHDEFLIERRLGYQAVVLFALAYVFDARGYWLLIMAISAGRLIWLRWSDTRDQRAGRPGDDDPTFVRWDIERRLTSARRLKKSSLGTAALFVALALVGGLTRTREFAVPPLVLSALFVAMAGRHRDVAALLERASAPTLPLQPAPAHHDAQ